MKTLPRSVRSKIEGLGKAGTLACGVTVHCADSKAIDDANLDHLGSSDDLVSGIKHTGWFSDPFQDETMTGHVYGNGRQWAPEFDGYAQCMEWDGESYYGFVAVVHTAGDTYYIDAEYHDDAESAGIAADAIAKSIAEHERECEECYCNAGRLRSELHEANDLRREAVNLNRLGVPCAQWRPLWEEGSDLRDAVWSKVSELRPSCWNRDMQESFMQSWREGWANS